MSIKFKHCCLMIDEDYVEVNMKYSEEALCGVITLSVYDSSIEHFSELYLDKRTAVRLVKSLKTEINKIQ